MQHNPTNDANMLRPTALPSEAMIFPLSCMTRLIDSTTAGIVGAAAGTRKLDWWAWQRSVGTEDATIARLGTKHRAACRTLIKVDASVTRHNFSMARTAFATCQFRGQACHDSLSSQLQLVLLVACREHRIRDRPRRHATGSERERAQAQRRSGRAYDLWLLAHRRFCLCCMHAPYCLAYLRGLAL